MTNTDTIAATLGPRETYDRLGLDQLSDVQLAAHAAATIRVPRAAPADSFVLHAPLELIARAALLPRVRPARSEEHTSELQSRRDLVCRLLLEKKKKKKKQYHLLSTNQRTHQVY